MVEKNIDANFFFDEVPNTVEAEELNSLSTKISKDKFLWIACKSNLPPKISILKGKFISNLAFQEIFQYSQTCVQQPPLGTEKNCRLKEGPDKSEIKTGYC